MGRVRRSRTVGTYRRGSRNQLGIECALDGRGHDQAYGVTRIETGGRMVTVVLAPVPRLNFRRLTENVLRTGRTMPPPDGIVGPAPDPALVVSRAAFQQLRVQILEVQGLPSRQANDEIRAEIIMIDGESFDMR